TPTETPTSTPTPIHPFLLSYGTPGSGVGEFNSPIDITVLGAFSAVALADVNNHRVQMLDFNGLGLVRQWGTGPSASNGNFNGPRGIHYASNGKIYVADTGNHRIQRFDSNGNYELEW